MVMMMRVQIKAPVPLPLPLSSLHLVMRGCLKSRRVGCSCSIAATGSSAAAVAARPGLGSGLAPPAHGTEAELLNRPITVLYRLERAQVHSPVFSLW